MPQRAHLLLKLAQTAAKAGQASQVSALPKLQDVYDTIREAQAANQHQQQPQAPRLSPGAAMLPDGLLHTFGRLSGGRAQQSPLLSHGLPLHGSLAVGQPSHHRHQPKPAQQPQQQQQTRLYEESALEAPASAGRVQDVAQEVPIKQQQVASAASANSSSSSNGRGMELCADESKTAVASNDVSVKPGASGAATAHQTQQTNFSSVKSLDAASHGDAMLSDSACLASAERCTTVAEQAAQAPSAATASAQSAPVQRPLCNDATPLEAAKPISTYYEPPCAAQTATTGPAAHRAHQAGHYAAAQPAVFDTMPWPAPSGYTNMTPPTPVWSQQAPYAPRPAAAMPAYGPSRAAVAVVQPPFRQPFVQQAPPRQQHNAAHQMPAQRGPMMATQQLPGQQQQQQQQQARPGKTGGSVSLNKQIMAAHGVRELAALVRAKGRNFDFFNISSAVARVPKLVGAASGNGSSSCGGVQLDSSSKALVDDLAALMARSISTFDARGLANAAWAFGKLRYSSNQRLPALIAEHAVPKMGDFSPQNLSNLLWACVYLHYRSDVLLEAAAEEVVEKLGMFKPQELANALWAFASLDYRSPALLAAAAQRCIEMAHAFKEQELSNTVWAFARMRYDEPRLRAALMYQVDTKLGALQHQGVANVAWALAASHTAGPNALPGSWGPAQANIAAAGDKGMHTDIESGYDVAGSWKSEEEVEAARRLLGRLVAKALPSLGFYDAQGLSNLVWAMGALGVRDGPAAGALLAAAAAKAERMGGQQLCNVLCGCAALGWADGVALRGWAHQVVAKADSFDAQALANTSWAFAQLGHHDAVVFEALAEAALPKVEAMTPQAAARMAWALSAAGCQHPRLHERLMLQASEDQRAVTMDNNQATWLPPAQQQRQQKQQQQQDVLAAFMPPPTPGQLHSAEQLAHLQQLASHFASPAGMLASSDSHMSNGSSDSNSRNGSFCIDSLYSADDAPVTPPQAARLGLLHGGFGPFGVEWGAAGVGAEAAGNDGVWYGGGAGLELYGL